MFTTCHVSCVVCHLSPVTCQLYHVTFFFFYKSMELVAGQILSALAMSEQFASEIENQVTISDNCFFSLI